MHLFLAAEFFLKYYLHVDTALKILDEKNNKKISLFTQ